MKFTLHKLKEGFVITSDENIKEDDKILYKGLSYTGNAGEDNLDKQYFAKVIAQQDQIDFSALTEEEQKKIGWVDCLKFAKEYFQAQREFHQDDFYRNAEPHQKDELYKRHDDLMSPIFVAGFQKAQELLSDKMFTIEDIRKAMEFGKEFYREISVNINYGMKRSLSVGEFIQSLSKISWEIEVEMETIGECDCPCHDPKFIIMHFMPCCYPQTVPKFTNNKIKIIKIL